MKSDEPRRLEAQRRAIRAACKRRGWRLVAVVEETGLSAKELKRPGIQAALRLLETDQEKALVAANSGRLSHLVPDLNALIQTAHKQGWALVGLDCAPETTRPAGEPEATLLASFAPCERQLISQRIRQALALKHAQGVRLGRPPRPRRASRRTRQSLSYPLTTAAGESAPSLYPFRSRSCSAAGRACLDTPGADYHPFARPLASSWKPVLL